ncbi:MAG: glycosyltransferase family 39 protein [Rivularia sp. (in: Bacteria)]|nr:glycosyltransferase family 39 protein [Rivularia sp. MS3]
MFKIKNFFLNLCSIILFATFIVAIRFEPITQSFELDYDEGLNLIKALLYSRGFSFYSQIWSDQPPLFTVILSYWLNLFGQSVFAARLLTLLFSSLLIWCFYQLIRRELGNIPAFIATVLLFTSWLYIRLSISVMIGLPSLSLAMLSIYLISLYKQNHLNRYLIFSGIAFALSLQTKAFTVFLIPLVMMYIWDFQINLFQFKKDYNLRNNIQNTFSALLQWIGILCFTYIIIALLFGQFSHQEQLVQTHLNQPINTEIKNYDNLYYLNFMTAQDRDYIFLAIVGILTIIYHKNKSGLLPITWFFTSTLILLFHKPIWYHHYHLISIPICWLAAYAIASLLDLLSQNWHGNLKSFFKSINFFKLIIISLISLIFVSLIFATPPITKGGPPKDLQLLQLVIKYKDSTNWVFTDRPIYAFYANLPVPPEMAVISSKRINSGKLTNQEMLEILKKYRPEQIVIARMDFHILNEPEIRNYVNKYYTKTYSNKKDSKDLREHEHYILSSLITQNKVNLSQGK